MKSTMEFRGTLALLRYFCEEFPSKNTRSRLLQKKSRNSVKSLGYITWIAPALLNALVIPSDTAARGSAVEREVLEIRKIWYFSKWSTSLLFTDFSKILLTTEKRIYRAVVLSVRPLHNILKHRETFQQSEKQESFKQKLKSNKLQWTLSSNSKTVYGKTKCWNKKYETCKFQGFF